MTQRLRDAFNARPRNSPNPPLTLMEPIDEGVALRAAIVDRVQQTREQVEQMHRRDDGSYLPIVQRDLFYMLVGGVLTCAVLVVVIVVMS